MQGKSKAWDTFLKPGKNNLAPIICMVVRAKNKNSQFGQATSNILKSNSGCRTLSLAAMLGIGLEIKVMWILFRTKFHGKMNDIKKQFNCEMECLKSIFHEDKKMWRLD